MFLSFVKVKWFQNNDKTLVANKIIRLIMFEVSPKLSFLNLLTTAVVVPISESSVNEFQGCIIIDLEKNIIVLRTRKQLQ